MSHLSRRAMLAGMLSTVAGQALANAPEQSLRPRLRPADGGKVTPPDAAEIVASAGLPGVVGYAVADARTGEVLEISEGDVALPPASVAKAITAAYALSVLGADHRFETQLIATGPVVDGTLTGDLVLVGGGDPVLATNDLAALVTRLREAGVERVNGRFLLWAGALPYVRTIDAGQPDHLGYSPAISGLNLNFNRVHFKWTREGSSYEVSMDAPAANYRPAVRVARMRIVDRSGPIYTYEGGAAENWTVARRALGGGGARWLPVRAPAAYTGDVFRTLAEAEDVRLPVAEEIDALPDGTTLATHRSEPLVEIVHGMLQYSTNLTAEVVGLTASIARGAAPETLAQSGIAMSSWAAEELGIEAGFIDHSGLGEDTRISAGAMAKALVSVGHDGPLRPLLKDVVMTNQARERLTNAPISVVAKTGTLNFVSGLAGYATTPGGRELTFAVFSADNDRRATLTRANRERPEGARGWSSRAKRIQQRLLQRWGVAYDS